MLEFSDALARVIGGVARVGGERVTLLDAAERVIGATLVCDRMLPPFDYSAMDGYAVASTSLNIPPPYILPVYGESRTGGIAPALVAGSACRIFTGAALPDGADAVVMQEDIVRDGDRIEFSARPDAGQHVRRAGEDLMPGTIALSAGTRLTPGALALAASLDRPWLEVARRPQVVVLCTGDELRAPGDPPRTGSIPDSNGVALAAMARRAGAAVTLAPWVGDSPSATESAVRGALVHADLLLTVGGVSVGDHDVVRPALEAAGVALEFWKVKMRPGKPLVFGRRGDTLVLGLPGNPVSAQVTFALFGMPLVRALQGDRAPAATFRPRPLAAPIRQKPGRTGFYRARLDAQGLVPLTNQASGAVTSMAEADALIRVHADSEGYPAGASVDSVLLSEL